MEEEHQVKKQFAGQHEDHDCTAQFQALTGYCAQSSSDAADTYRSLLKQVGPESASSFRGAPSATTAAYERREAEYFSLRQREAILRSHQVLFPVSSSQDIRQPAGYSPRVLDHHQQFHNQQPYPGKYARGNQHDFFAQESMLRRGSHQQHSQYSLYHNAVAGVRKYPISRNYRGSLSMQQTDPLMREVIGLRRSTQNLPNYREVCCASCVQGVDEQRTGGAPLCSQCRRNNKNAALMTPARTRQLRALDPASVKSCRYSRQISPIDSQLYQMQQSQQQPNRRIQQPFYQANDAASQSQFSNDHYYNCRQKQHQQLPSSSGSKPQMLIAVGGLLGDQHRTNHACQSHATLSPAGITPRRLQPSQSHTALYATNAPAIPHSHSQLSLNPPPILTRNPCNFCGNADCFQPQNGGSTSTCCFELLKKEKEEQARRRLEEIERQARQRTAMQLHQREMMEESSIEVTPIDQFWLVRGNAAEPEEQILRSAQRQRRDKKKQKVIPPQKRKLVQAGVQTVNEVVVEEKATEVTKTCQEVQVQTVEEVKQEESKGNYELQKRVAMLYRLTAFFLTRATNRQQTPEQSYNQLVRHRELFDESQAILQVLKKQPMVLADTCGFDKSNTCPRPIDEDALYETLRERLDAALTPNANLFKYYQMPAKFEGELLLIMYLLSNTLDEIYERLKFVPPKAIPVVKNGDQCFGLEHGAYCRQVTTEEYEEDEVNEEEMFLEMGFADRDEISLSKSNVKVRSAPPKADLAGFDREKFYRRLGIDPESNERETMIMIAEQQMTSECGSVGLADTEEVNLEKNRPVEANIVRALDYRAFCEKQGVSNADPEADLLQHIMIQRQLTTEEFEQEMADEPLELSRSRPQAIMKKVLPDMGYKAVKKQREVQLPSAVQSDAPTERKSIQNTYQLPMIEPMMSTWTYTAIRHEEEEKQTHSKASFVQDELAEVVDKSISDELDETVDAENILETSDQELITNYKKVHRTVHEDKIKLNDYVFDERQNLLEDFMQIELKQMVCGDTRQIASIVNARSSSPKRNAISPSKSIQIREIIPTASATKQEVLTRQYLDIDAAYTVNNAVHYISPVQAVHDADPEVHESMLNVKFKGRSRQRNKSPNSLPRPPSEDADPYLPYRSTQVNQKASKHSLFKPFSNQSFSSQKRTSGRDAPTKNIGVSQSNQKIFSAPKVTKLQFGSIQRAQQQHQLEQPTGPRTTKLGHSNMQGSFTERMNHNQDPTSFNLRQITIDDDGNMRETEDEDFTKPFRRTDLSDDGNNVLCTDEENVQDQDEARTFISSNLLFSHLMTFDTKKNTLSQLNKANRASLLQKGLQREARGGPDELMLSQSSHRRVSPFRSNSRRSGSRGGVGLTASLRNINSNQWQPHHQQQSQQQSHFLHVSSVKPTSAQVGRKKTNLAQLLEGGQQNLLSGKSTPKHNFKLHHARADDESANRQYFFRSVQYPNEAVSVKKATKFFDPLLDTSGITDHQVSHTQREAGLMYGGGTFANQNILHQEVIPEQMHEETHRNLKMINTARFVLHGDRSFEDSKRPKQSITARQLQSSHTQQKLSQQQGQPPQFGTTTSSMVKFMPEDSGTRSLLNSERQLPQPSQPPNLFSYPQNDEWRGDIEEYEGTGDGESTEGQNALRPVTRYNESTSNNYEAKRNRSSTITNGAQNSTLDQYLKGVGQQTTSTQNQKTAFDDRYLLENGGVSAESVAASQPSNSVKLVIQAMTANDDTDNGHKLQVRPMIKVQHLQDSCQLTTGQLGPGFLQFGAGSRSPSRDTTSWNLRALHEANANKMRSMSSAYNRVGGAMSRQTDLLRSELNGGRSSAQDSSSAFYMHKMMLDLKRPQASDITPVFRLTKARKMQGDSQSPESVPGASLQLRQRALAKNFTVPQSPNATTMHQVKMFEQPPKRQVKMVSQDAGLILVEDF